MINMYVIRHPPFSRSALRNGVLTPPAFTRLGPSGLARAELACGRSPKCGCGAATERFVATGRLRDPALLATSASL